MRGIYSTLFLALVGLEGTYEIAPDFANVRVLRDVDVYWPGGPQVGPSFHLIGSSGQTIWEAHSGLTTGVDVFDSQTFQWRGRQVIPVGGTIAVTAREGFPLDVSVSGYTLHPAPPGPP